MSDLEEIVVCYKRYKKVLEDKTRIPVWIVKYDTSGNPIESVDGTGTENVPEIKTNIDSVPTIGVDILDDFDDAQIEAPMLPQEESEELFTDDIQKQLEAKFDELFGPLDDED